MPRCDLLLVMGTSLEVYPFAGLIGELEGVHAQVASYAKVQPETLGSTAWSPL